MMRNRVLDASNVKDTDASFIVFTMNFSKGQTCYWDTGVFKKL